MSRKVASTVGAVGIYARISLDRNDGEGVARQLADARQLAAERWPAVDVREYVDNDISAFRAKRRPEYEHLLSDLREKVLGAVVAYHPDRLYRRPADLEAFIDAVQTAGAEVATVKAGDVDLSTASGRMVARILGSVSRHESERIGERVSRAKQERAAQGRPAGGGLRPFGLQEDRSDVVESEAEVLRCAAADILAGTSWSKVVRDLNDTGVRNVTGNQWTVGNLRRTLTSPHVAGLRAYKDEIVGQAVWPAILDRETWERLRAAASRRKRGRPPSDKHLLTGLLECGRCGFPMWANHTGRGDRWEYRCSPTSTTKGKGCGRMSISRDPLEALISQAALGAIDQSAVSDAVAHRRPAMNAAGEVERLEGELNALAEDHGAGRITRAEWLRAREGLAQRLDEAKAAIASSDSAAVTQELADLAERWDALEMADRRRAIAAMIRAVRILPAEKRGMPPTVEGVGRIDIERVDIEWRA